MHFPRRGAIQSKWTTFLCMCKRGHDKRLPVLGLGLVCVTKPGFLPTCLYDDHLACRLSLNQMRTLGRCPGHEIVSSPSFLLHPHDDEPSSIDARGHTRRTKLDGEKVDGGCGTINRLVGNRYGSRPHTAGRTQNVF